MNKVFVAISLFFVSNIQSYSGGKGPLELQKDGLRNERPYYMDKVGVDEKLGDSIDLSLEFKNVDGRSVKLGEFFSKKKPVFLMLIYYTCPTLCSLHFSNLMKTFRDFKWDIGDKFEFVAVSIDPRETSKDAKKKLLSSFEEYGRLHTRDGWHFLTGQEKNIRSLASSVGFNYVWDPNMEQWAHTSVAYVITPSGKISFYHYGLNISPKDLRLSLVEASDNKIGNVMDQVLLFCMQYDPSKKKYAFYAFNIMSVAAGLMALILGGYLFAFWYKQKHTKT